MRRVLDTLLDAGRSLFEPRLKVLAYHGVETRDPEPWEVGESEFCRQLDWLVERAHPVLRLSDALDALALGTLPPGAVSITFDDAHASIAEVALPRLRERELAASVFVPTGFAGKPDTFSGHARPRRVLGWDEIRALAGAGVDAQSHTVNHVDLTTLDEGELRRELEESRVRLEVEVGPVAYLAYPFGYVDARVRAVARQVGYRGGLEFGSTRGNWRGTHPFGLKREMVTTRTTLREFARKVDASCDLVRTLATRASRALPAGPSLARGWVDTLP